MKIRHGYAKAAATLIVLSAVILAAFIMTGCQSITHTAATVAGFEPDRPVVQRYYAELVIPIGDKKQMLTVCRDPNVIGCSFVHGLDADGICTVVYYKHDRFIRYHERHHCHVGCKFGNISHCGENRWVRNGGKE